MKQSTLGSPTHGSGISHSGSQRPIQLLVAFLLGVLATCACTLLATRLPALSFEKLISRMEGVAVGPGHQPCAIQTAPGIALSPQYLANAANNATVTTDILIVAARHEQDTSWLDVYLSHIPHVVYQVADPLITEGAQHATLADKGREAMGYLQFIIDYYDRLPASIAFVHGFRNSWHLRDHIPILRRLKWGALPYANLRFQHTPDTPLDWRCGPQANDSMYEPWPGVRRDCDWVGNVIRPMDIEPRSAANVTELSQEEWADSVEMHVVWNQVFEAELGALPELLTGPCCAEFMVSRDRIRAHSRSFYIRLRDWILTTEVDSYRSGRVFEYMWPVMFGEPAVTAPVPECDLLHCYEPAVPDAWGRRGGPARSLPD